MLMPDQVLPFLLHDKPFVRSHAIDYFRYASCVGALTADHYWRAIDQFGLEESRRCFSNLVDLPQTETSFARAMEMLADDGSTAIQGYLYRVVAQTDLGIVRAHQEELLDCPHLSAELRDHLRERLALINVPPAALWQRLMDFGREVGNAYVGDFDERVPQRLIEALARNPATIIEPAMGVLDEPEAIDDWRGIFAVRFLGATRYEPSADRLIEILTIDADVLLEAANEALARFGTASVAGKLAAFYPGKPWEVRLYTHAALENIKLPESETALLSCLDYEDHALNEEEDSLHAMLLGGLCRLGSMAGYERARKLIEINPHHPEVRGLFESQMGVAIMTGTAIAEAEEWLPLAERQYARSERLLRLDDFPNSSAPAYDDDDPWDPLAEFEDDDDVDLMGPYPSRASKPLGTYRRSEPKIGRNDPCPCGSGKKYKKCCWANE